MYIYILLYCDYIYNMRSNQYNIDIYICVCVLMNAHAYAYAYTCNIYIIFIHDLP